MGTSYLRLLTRKENREVEMAQLSKKPGDEPGRSMQMLCSYTEPQGSSRWTPEAVLYEPQGNTREAHRISS